MAKGRKRRDENETLSLQTTKKTNGFDAPPPHFRKNSSQSINIRMNRFLRAFEQVCGNVSASCQMSGIDRRTYYRWIDPNFDAPIYRRFRKKLARIKPEEKLVDAAEFTIAGALAKGDVTAAIFTLKTRGRHRGWIEPGRGDQPNPQVIADAAVKAVQAYQLWLTDNPDASESEKSEWLGRFSSALNVDQKEVVRTMKIQELTASVQ